MRKIWGDKERAETKKICFKCNKEKSLLDYYRHREMKDGHLNKCKLCAKKDVSNHRLGNLKKVRAYDRKRSKLPHRVKYNTENTKKFRQNSPLAYKAHSLVASALKCGRLSKPDVCSVCDKNGRQIEGHHDDYTKPLNIIWLCAACHRQLHRDLNQQEVL